MKRIHGMAARVLAAMVLTAGLTCIGWAAGAAHTAQARSQSGSALVEHGSLGAVDLAVPVVSEALTTGCNQVTYTTLPVGGNVGAWVAVNVTPFSAAVSVWHFDNPTQKFKAMWFSTAAVPVDLPTFPAAIDGFFICVNAAATGP